MRYIGAAALSCAALLISVWLNARRKRRGALLGRLADFFTAFGAYTELSPLDVAAAARRLARNGGFGQLGFLPPFADRCDGADVRRVWREETASFSDASLLTGEERELLEGFADRFGLTSLAAFTEACRQYAALFAGFREKDRREREKNGSLLLGAGALAAALLLIVFW